MCKPSCCPPPASSTGLGPLAAIAAGLALAAVAAGPAAAAVTSLLHALTLILAITAATCAGLVILIVTVAIIYRTRRAPRYHTPTTIPARAGQAFQIAQPGSAAPPLPPPRFELTEAERAYCTEVGVDPEQVAQLMAATLGGLQ